MPLEFEILSDNDKDDILDFEVLEEERSWWDKTKDVTKEVTAGIADIFRDFEMQHERRARDAEAEVEQGLDFRDMSVEEIRALGKRAQELKESGISPEEQLAEQQEFRAGMVKGRAEEGVKGAQRMQEAMPKPEHAPEGIIETGIRGLARFAVPMATTAVSGGAGITTMFSALRGAKVQEFDQKRAMELSQAKDPQHAEAIKNKYSPENVEDAATLHALINTGIEYGSTVTQFGAIGKLLRGRRSTSRLKGFVGHLAKIGSVEAGEEWLQAHGELVADMFFENPDADYKELGDNVWKEFKTWKHQKEAAKAAAAGAVGGALLGLFGGAVNIVSPAEKTATEKLTRAQRKELESNKLIRAEDFREEEIGPGGFPTRLYVEPPAPRGTPTVEKTAEPEPADIFETLDDTETPVRETQEPKGLADESQMRGEPTQTRVQTTQLPGGIASGVGTQEKIILEDRMRTEQERLEAAQLARETKQKELHKEQQLAAEMAERKRAERAAEIREQKRQTELTAQRLFEDQISTRDGLIKRSMSLLPAMEDSGDPNLRKAAAVAKKAHKALAVDEDNTKKMMEIQNDLRVEQQRVADPRSQALLLRLEEELGKQVARVDTLVAQEKAAGEEKKPAETEKQVTAEFLGYQRPLYKGDQPIPLFNLIGGENGGSTVALQGLEKAGVTPPAFPKPKGEDLIPQINETRQEPGKHAIVTETPYKTEAELVTKKAAEKRSTRQTGLKEGETRRETGKREAAKGVEGAVPYQTQSELALKKALAKKVKAPKKVKPRRTTVEEAPYEQKERQVYYVGKKPAVKETDMKYQLMTPKEAAGQIKDNTYVNGTPFGNIVTKIETKDKSISKDLTDVVTNQGSMFYIDLMHPAKVGARLYDRMRKKGMSHAAAKQSVNKALEEYKLQYEEVAAKYLLGEAAAAPQEAGGPKEIRAQRTALRKHRDYLAEEIDRAMQRARLAIKNLPGGSIRVTIARNPNEISNESPDVYGRLSKDKTLDKAKALYDPNTNTIFLFTDRFPTTLDAKRSLWHELGHTSLAKLLGKDLNSVLDSIAKKHPKLIEEKKALGYTNDRTAAEDVLIDMFTANKSNTFTSRLRELLSKLVRKMGFKTSEITQEDMVKLVRNIRANLTGEKVESKDVARMREKARKEEGVEYTEELKYQLVKEGGKGSALGNILKWDYFKIAKAAGGPDKIQDYMEKKKVYAGRKITPEGRKYISNTAARFEKNPEVEQELKELTEIRKQLAVGILKEDSPRYKDVLKKYGSKIEGSSIRHTARFPVGVNTVYGSKLSSDTAVEQIKRHPVRGTFKTITYKDKAGKTVIDAPILLTNKKQREKQIDQLFQKNKQYSTWYKDWNEFTQKLKNQHVSDVDAEKYIRIQAILSAGSGPQGNQKLFRTVIDSLRSGKEIKPGPRSKGGVGITKNALEKIQDIWNDNNVPDTLEGMINRYGRKIGPYMMAGLNPQHPDAVVIDRHMPRLWGYNILWSPNNKHDQFTVRPEVEQQIVQEIKDAAKRNNTTPAGVQAALWFGIRPPDVEAESYRMAAKIKPSKYLPKVFYQTTVPESVGMGVHYKDTLVDKGDFVLGATKDGKIKYNQYSRNDVGKRIEAHTEKNPYQPLVYMYEAGTQPEAMAQRGKKPHIINLDKVRIYDGINDPLNFNKTVAEIKEQDPFAHSTNIAARLIKQTGDYDGFMIKNPYGEGHWILAFEKAVVEETPVVADIGISDVVEGMETLPQDIKQLEKLLGKRSRDFIKRIEGVKRRYPEIKILGAKPSLAQFQAATSAKMETGLALQLEGPPSAIRAFLSELGIENNQREIYFMHTEGESNGTLFRFKIKPRFKNPAALRRALKQIGLKDYNMVIDPDGLFIQQYVFGESGPEIDQMAEVREMLEDKTFPSNEDFDVNSEILGNDDVELALDNYKENIVKYLGEKNGSEIYDKAIERRKAYQERIRSRAVQAPLEGKGAEVQDREAAQELGTGDLQEIEPAKKAPPKKFAEKYSEVKPEDMKYDLSPDAKEFMEKFEAGLKDVKGKEITPQQFANKQAWQAMNLKRSDVAAILKNMQKARADRVFAMAKGGRSGFFKALADMEANTRKKAEKLSRKAAKRIRKERGLPKDAVGFIQKEFTNFIMRYNSIKTKEDAVDLRKDIDTAITDPRIRELFFKVTKDVDIGFPRGWGERVAPFWEGYNYVWDVDTDMKYQLLTPEEKKALDHIGYSEETKGQKGKREDLLEMNWFERNVLQPITDSLYAIGKLEKGKDLGSLSGYKSFNMLSNFPAMFTTFLRHGRVSFRDNWMAVQPEEDGGLFTVQEHLGDTSESFFKRMTAKSAQELLDKDDATVAAGGKSRFKPGVNLFGKDKATGELLDDRDMIQKLYSATSEEYQRNKKAWDWAERRLRELSKSVLDFAEKANLINPESRQVFEREFYIPFFRITDENFEGSDLETLFPKSPGVTHVGKIHKLEGSHKNVGDPFANLVNTYSFVLNQSLKNLARGKTLSLAKGMGLIEKTNKAGKDTVGIRVKGKEIMYKVHDRFLYESLVDVDTFTDNFLSKGAGNWIFRKPKLWLTKYVTYDPAFRIANFLRDTLHTAAMQDGFIPIISSAKGFYHAFKGTPEFQEYVSTGGAFSGAYHERDIRGQTAEEVKKLKKSIKMQKKPFMHPYKLFDMYRRLGEAGENAARMGVFMIQQKKGKSKFEAAYAAKDLLDFHRSGNAGWLKFFIQTVPFLNARIQGIYKLGRTGLDHKTRKNFYAVASMMALASLAYSWATGDDDRYKELTDGDRLMYWHFFDVPGLGHVKIPRPFELGSFFGSIPEAIFEYLRGIRGGDDTVKFMSQVFRDMLRIDQPQTAKVIYQQVANKNFFTGAPIVPPAKIGAAPEAQYKEKTSKMAREIGKFMNQLGYTGPASSPLRIDHFFQDMFSYGAYMGAHLTDIVLDYMLDYPKDPAERPDEGFNRLVLGIGRFVKGKDEVPKYTKSQGEFYELLSEANEAADTYRIYMRMRDREKAREWRTGHRREIRASKRLSKYQRRVSLLNQRIDVILASRKYSPREKREKIDELLKRKHKLYRKAVRWGKEYLHEKGSS